MGDVSEYFIKPLMRHFNLPKGAADDPEGWLRDYEESLGSFGDDVLRLAAKITRERPAATRTFPVIDDCNAACKHAFDEIHYSRHRGDRPNNRNDDQAFYDKYPEWSELRRQQAYSLMRGEMGMEAAEDLWVCALFDFCRVNRRLPDRYEKEGVVKTGAKTLGVIGLSGADASILKSMTKLSSQFLRDFFRRHDAICKKIGAEQHLLMAKTNLG
jgi:hypothetical protein